MKKRIVSIFLILSIVASLFAVSAVSTSAVTTPTITSIVVYPTKINVNWTKGSNISYYAVWVLNKSTGKWSAYKSSKTYINFDKLKPGINYAFQIRAVDNNGRIGSFSKARAVSFTFPQKPVIHSCRNGYGTSLSLQYGVQNYNTGFIATGIPYAQGYDVIINQKKASINYVTNDNNTAISINKNGIYSFQVRAVCNYKGKRFFSPWSDISYSFPDK